MKNKIKGLLALALAAFTSLTWAAELVIPYSFDGKTGNTEYAYEYKVVMPNTALTSFTTTIRYAGGSHRVEILSVKLLDGETEYTAVATGTEGTEVVVEGASYSGGNNYHNIYTFTNEEGFTANKVYTLQANLKVTNANPSHNGNIKVSGGITLEVQPFSFGVNFKTADAQNISTTTGAGFAKGDYAAPVNWANYSADGGNHATYTIDTTSIDVSWVSRGSWNSGCSTDTDAGKLLHGYLDDTANNGRTKATVTISGLPKNKKYAVALVLSGDGNGDANFNNRFSPVWINNEVYAYNSEAMLVKGDAAKEIEFWGSRAASAAAAGLVEGTNVMFVEGLSGGAISITSAMDNQNVSRLTIAGVQVWVTDEAAEAPAAPEDKETISLNFYSSQGSVSGEAGLVAAGGWNNLGNNGSESALNVWTGEKAVSYPMALTYSSNNGYQWTDATDAFLKGYLDDGGNHAQISLTGIPFEEYSVIVYAATDTASRKFRSVTINGQAYIGTPGATTLGYALPVYNNTHARYGTSHALTAAYGTNALRVDGLSGDLTIAGGANEFSARGGIAAIQIINTGTPLPDAQVIDWTSQSAEQLKTSELPELTNVEVQLKLSDGATLEMDSDIMGHTIEIVGNNVTVNVTNLEISQAAAQAIFPGATVTTAYTETIGYTKDGVTYSLVYRGGMDGWTELSNWYIGTRTNGSETYWIPYTGTVVPGAPDSNKWDVGLIDGDLIGDKITADEDGYKVVNTPTLEGWALTITIANGVHIKVPTMNKLQGDCVINVDATSKMTVTNKGSGNNGTANTYNIDAEEGLVFENMAMPGGTAYLGLKGSITTGTFANQQTIGGVTLDLGDSTLTGRKVVTRTLYTYTSGTTFSVAENAVTTSVEGVTPEAVDILQNVGQYKFETKAEGYCVSYVAYAENDEIGEVSTWTAKEDTTWATEGNWTFGVPTAGADAVISIDADTTITIPAEGVTVGVLTVNGEGALTIAGGKLTATKILAKTSIAADETTLALAEMDIAEGKTVTYTTTTTVVANLDTFGKSHALALKALTGEGTLVKKGTGVIGLFATAAEPAIIVEEGAIYVREVPTTAMNIAAKAGAEIRLAAWNCNFNNSANSLKLDGGAQLTLANKENVSGTITIANATETAAKICGSSFNASTISAAITGAGKVEFADGGTFGEGAYPCEYATTYSGVISGDLQVIISDTSAVTFTAANTYTGGTVIAEGVTVTVSDLTSIFGTGAITGAGTVKIAGGTYNGLSLAQYTDANTTIVIPADSTVTGYFNSATWTCAAKIQLDGTLSLTDGFGVGKYTFTGPWAGAGAISLSHTPADVVRITGDISDFTGNISIAGGRALTFCAESTAFNQKYAGKICVHGDYAYTAKVNGTWSAPVVVENGAKIGGEGSIDNTLTFNAGSIIDGSVAATGDVTLNGTVTVSGEAGATVLTCANAASLDLTKFAAPAGLKCVADGNTVKLAVAKVNVTIPAAPANTKWYDADGNVVEAGTIAVDPNTDVTLTLKAEEGYVFADGSTSTTVTVNSGAEGATVETPDVTAATPVAQVGETKYQTLDAAIVATTDEANEVILLADIELTTFVTITKSLTLDLNGKSIDRADGTALYVNGDATVTIQGEGSVSGSQAVYVGAGIVVIKGGNFHGYNGGHAVYVQGTGKVEILDGTFSIDPSGSYDYVLNKYDADRETTSIVVKGGKFENFNPADNGAEGVGTNFCDEDFAAIEGEGENAGYYVVVDAVAKIGNVGYATFDAAFAAAEAGDTIILLAPVTITSDTTIDLAGKNITSDGDVFIVTAGTLTINGEGVITANTDNAGTANAVWADGGAVVINGGTWSCGGDTETTDVTHQNDTIYTKNGGTVTINGGTFEYTENVWTLNENDKNRGTISVTGGKFKNFNPADNTSEGANTNFCAEGYEATEDADGYWTVVEAKPAVAKIGDTEYETLQAAVEAAGANATVELLADTTENITVPAGFTGTIDLGGKTLTGNVQAAYNAATTTDFILQNGYIITPAGNTDKGAIFIKYAAVELIDIDLTANYHGIRTEVGGNVTINGGRYESICKPSTQYNVVYAKEDSTITIEDGTFIRTPNGGTVYCINPNAAASEIYVNGGSFTTIGSVYLVDMTAKGTCAISGGLFSVAAKNDVNQKLASGYGIEDVVDTGYFTVVEKPAIEPDGSIEVSAADAAAAANKVEILIPEGVTGVDAATYATYFTKTATLNESTGKYTVTAALNPEVVTPKITAIGFDGDKVTVSLENELSGLYYAVRSAATVDKVDTDEATVTTGLNAPATGDAAFYRVLVDFAPIAATPAE